MNKKRVCFIFPNQRWFKEDNITTWNLNPTTLTLLGAMIKDKFEVKIIDAQFYNMSKETFLNEIKVFNPHYAGISQLSSEYEKLLEITSKIIKEFNSEIITIAGGVHVTVQPELALSYDSIDYGVIGEGEYVFRELLLYLENQGDFPNIGVAYRKDNKIIVQNRAFVEDLRKLPWPDYEMINYEDYLETDSRQYSPNRPPDYPFVRMVTTRGCPFGCSFCQVESISGKKVRARDPQDVVEELLYLKKRYGIKAVVFDEDNILMAPNSYAKNLFTLMIEKELNLKWVATAFALFLIDDELLDLMKESGCIGINVAIESGNKRVLKEIVKKPIKDLIEVPKIIAKIKAKDMYCIANFIVGFPGETWEEVRETFRYAEKCGADYVKFYAAIPLHGTQLFEIAQAMGYMDYNPNISIVDWRYGQITSDEWTAKDISILRAYEWDRINFSPEKIERVAQIWGCSIEELKKIRKETRDILEFS